MPKEVRAKRKKVAVKHKAVVVNIQTPKGEPPAAGGFKQALVGGLGAGVGMGVGLAATEGLLDFFGF
jgi:predicted lipid-binding transport protein (Tim44 family)